jgi:hypothetical protein
LRIILNRLASDKKNIKEISDMRYRFTNRKLLNTSSQYILNLIMKAVKKFLYF